MSEEPYLLYCGGEQCRDTISGLQRQISALKLDLEEAYRLNATRYQDGYDAAAGPLAAERIKRLKILWEGAKKRNRELASSYQELEDRIAGALV